MPIILVFGFLAYNISWLTRNGPLDVHISTTTKIGVDHAANSVIVFFAKTECDDSVSSECCLQGSAWNGTSCKSCPTGTYGVGFGATDAKNALVTAQYQAGTRCQQHVAE